MLKSIDKKKLKQINHFINQQKYNENYPWKMGYQNFGLLLFGFCEWIHNQKKDRQIDKLFFLARDGYIIKQAYEILYPNDQNSYLYVSRRSLSLPPMKNAKSIDELLQFIILPPMFTIDIFLSVFNIEPISVQKELDMCKIQANEIFKRSTFRQDPKILKLTKVLYQKIMKKAEEQNHNFLSYLKQENFEGNIGIVDIGWHNSIQYALLNVVNDVKINGFYLGIHRKAKKIQSPHKAIGYLYHYKNDLEQQYLTFSFVSLLETMFLSHEGTTIGYQKDHNKFYPILAPYEYNEELASLQIVDDFQKGAIQFIKDYKKSDLYKTVELNSKICSYNLLHFGNYPNKKNLKIFGNISFENYQIHNIINFNHNSFYYFTHPKTMIQDFYTSGWRVAFLKKLFKIPLPYSYFIKLLCKIFEEEQKS